MLVWSKKGEDLEEEERKRRGEEKKDKRRSEEENKNTDLAGDSRFSV